MVIRNGEITITVESSIPYDRTGGEYELTNKDPFSRERRVFLFHPKNPREIFIKNDIELQPDNRHYYSLRQKL